MYKPVSNKHDFNQMEEKVLAFWKEHDTFKKSLEQTRGKQEFVFYDGPRSPRGCRTTGICWRTPTLKTQPQNSSCTSKSAMANLF